MSICQDCWEDPCECSVELDMPPLTAKPLIRWDKYKRLLDENARLREALVLLLDEKVDYMSRNHLGDPEAQHTVKQARKALEK